ncbi:sulfite exporter TauE/SafE family protein [Methanosarcina sp. MSH10X1]|uniref:sulfite exporter TauE/SafE family protein n=1 Tax=Methanosarcina sp. MSH10X1 TaxID=2507075 RepID=UPI000FFB7CE0|nr:sulfite exporter TauE/SafE family protein [Methanosarcina sp. MSH10X1]RXA18481.1 sulfite exporter TauE/SafE family protein [Methanosarcina sp. MSH10X1]
MISVEPLYLVILIFTGVFTGVISGLLGVGGGFVMTPVQYWLLQETGLEPDLAIRIALGTSLFVILLNSMTVALKYNQKQAVLWRQAMIMGVTGSVFSFGGAAIASRLSASTLSAIFGIVVIIGALRTYVTPAVREQSEISPKPELYILAGVSIGFFSGLLGIGGGVIAIPIMLIILHFEMRKAVGTSAAVIIFTSFGGSIGYIINGWGQPGLPPYSLGYINLINWVMLAVPGFLAARKGAEIAHLVNPEHLKHLFVLLMVYVGLEMIGII